jgi:hypothetical protein
MGNEELMVKSAAYPGLERHPGGPDNWVEATGGLPKYIERIAKHLHYEKGYSISRSIAIAVNTVKRWARKGGVVKYGDPHNKHVTTITASQAAAAVAEWEAKKAAAHALRGGSGRGRMGGKRSIRLTEETLTVDALAQRANAIVDPDRRGTARRQVIELAVFHAKQRRELAKTGAAMSDGSFPIRNAQDLQNAIRLCGRSKHPAAAKRHIMRRARALGLVANLPESWRTVSMSVDQIDLARRRLTTDGRPSFKGNGGKYKHGFIPVNAAAVTAKAKGSPIARRRITRLYGAGGGSATSGQLKHVTATTTGGGTTTAKNASQLRGAKVSKAPAQHRPDQGIISDISTGGAGRAGRGAAARKDWTKIPDNRKTIRNGKRYVLTTYNGKSQLTPWVGPQGQKIVPANTNRIVSLDTRTANNMSKSQLRKALRTSGKLVGKAARKSANAAYRAKLKAGTR